MQSKRYWERLRRERLTRRTMLSASARAAVGASGLALVGCGDDDDDDAVSQAPAPAEQAAEPAAEQAAGQADEQAAPADQAEEEEAVAPAPEKQIGGTLRTWDLTDPISFDQFATFGYQVFLHGHNTYPKLTQLKVGPD
jgi:hypothetical protein